LKFLLQKEKKKKKKKKKNSKPLLGVRKKKKVSREGLEKGRKGGASNAGRLLAFGKKKKKRGEKNF